jgi:TatA/E family protein of Tat protein translocase
VSLGPAEILVIFVIALLVFGPQRLPEIGRQVGRGVREVRKFQQSLRSDLDDALAEDVAERAEPAPTLPPLPDATPAAPAAEAGDVTADVEVAMPDPDPQTPPPPPPVPPDPT